MSSESDRLTRYLLGTLPLEEREGIEEQIFTDDELHEELQATADDLIHAYLAGGLTRDDRARFESHFLASPRHRQRLGFVRDLLSAVGRVSAGSVEAGRPGGVAAASRVGRWGAAAAVLLVASAAAFLGARLRLGGPAPPADPNSPPATAEPGTARGPAARPPGETPEPRTAGTPAGEVERSIRLPRRPGPQPVEVSLSTDTRFVRLEVSLPDDRSPSYDAVVRHEQAEVWKAEGLEPPAPGGRLILTVPARVLTAGDYTLLIRGEALRGSASPSTLAYPLRVVRER